MEIHIRINECEDCKHSDHTGAFTKGGAKPCCGHPVTVKEKGYSCFDRIIPYKNVWSELYNRNLHQAKGIPKWCPLKNGYKYQ